MSIETEISRINYDINQLKKNITGSGNTNTTTFYVSGSDDILSGNEFYISGSSVILSSSTSTNTLFITSSSTSSIQFYVSGSNDVLTGSQFYISGSNITLSSSAVDNTLYITASANSLGITADSGSTISSNSFNFYGSGGVTTYTITPDTILIDSFTITGSTGINIIPVTSSILTPTTIALGHFDTAITSPPTTLTTLDSGKVGFDNPTVYWQGIDTNENIVGTPIKFGAGAVANYGGLILPIYNATNPNTYLQNANGLSGDFTLEFWIYPGAIVGYNYGIAALGSNGGTNSIYIGQLSGEFWIGDSTGASLTGVTWSGINTWHAIALCRKDNITRLYLDGVLIKSLTDLDGGTNTNFIKLGTAPTTVGTVPGYLDECRFSNSALYTGASYTTASAPFQNYSSSSYTTTTQYQIGLANNFLHVQTQTGSLSGSQLNLVGDCNIQTSVSGSNVVISSLAKQLTGSTNITVQPLTTTSGDPNTLFLWHMDEANGESGSVSNGLYTTPLLSQNITYASISTAQAKWGSASGFCNGNTSNNGKFLATSSAQQLQNIGGTTGSFTVELYAYPTNNDASGRSLVHINSSAAANYGFQIGVYDATSLWVNDGVSAIHGFTNCITQNAWNYITVTRQSPNVYVFVNGVLQGTFTSDNFYSPDQVQIGGYDSDNTYNWKGYVDEIRISDICRYTNSYTPPTGAFPNYGTIITNPCVNEVLLNDDISLASVTASAGFSGNLYGTASYAINAATASLLSGFNPSEYATLIGLSASFVDNSELTSAIQNFPTRAEVTGVLNGYVTTSSFNSFTASYNTGSFSGSFYGTASYALSSSYANSASHAITASYVLNSAPAIPRYGKVVIVDSLNGNDSLGAINGYPFATVNAAVDYVSSSTLTNTLIYIAPNTYTLTKSIVLPNTCALRGMSAQTTTLVLSGSGAETTMVTMGENSRIEDLNLKLVSTSSTTNLTGIKLLGTTGTTSKLRTAVLTVDNSAITASADTNVYGIWCSGSSDLSPSDFSFNYTRGVTVNVFSNGGGKKRGIYADTNTAVTFRDTNIYVRAPTNALSTGSYVGVETTNESSSLQFRTTSISGAPTSGSYTGSDIYQFSPATGFINYGIQLGPGSDLITKTAGGRPFTTYVTPTTLNYGLRGNVGNGTNYYWIGNQTTGDATQVFYRFQQKSILQGMSVQLRTPPGSTAGTHIVNVKVYKSTTGVAGSGVLTVMTASLTDGETSAYNYNCSVDFQIGQFLAVATETVGGAGTAADLVVQLDVF
jgi:hypothetical protein